MDKPSMHNIVPGDEHVPARRGRLAPAVVEGILRDTLSSLEWVLSTSFGQSFPPTCEFRENVDNLRRVIEGINEEREDYAPTPHETGEPDNLPRDEQERAQEVTRHKR